MVRFGRKEPESTGTVWAQLVVDELKDQQHTKTTVEQRGLAVISTSGALVALVLALVSFAAARNPGAAPALPGAARVLVNVALGLFVLAAVGGLAVAYPRRYPEIPVPELRTMVDIPRWTEPDNTAAWRLAQARIEMLAKARQLNGVKASLLAAALGIEVLGVACTGVSVVLLGVGR